MKQVHKCEGEVAAGIFEALARASHAERLAVMHNGPVQNEAIVASDFDVENHFLANR